MEYIIEEKELKKISLQFRRAASRLLNTEFEYGVDNSKRLVEYIQTTPIIYDFILKNSGNQVDIKKAISEKVRGRFIIPFNKADEIEFVYSLLLYISKNVRNYGVFAHGYGTGTKIQAFSDGLNSDVVKPFINHIIEYLEEIKIDMGMDEKTSINISVKDINGQVNISQNDSILNATYFNSSDGKKIDGLIDEISRLFKDGTSSERFSEVEELLVTIKDELHEESPKKTIIGMCKDRLNVIAPLAKNSVEILANLATLYTFIQAVL